jgi:hypothetical protein
MILYHGSNIEIENIDLAKCRPFKDFGRGFYLTTRKDQAQKMANRVSRIYGGSPCVNVYEFDETVLQTKELNIRTFDKPTKEWALFVINNRNRRFAPTSDEECNLDLKYDLVIGPVANDDLALLFRQFSEGMIGVDTLVREMEFKKLTDQYSFHTEKALGYLKKAGVSHD